METIHKAVVGIGILLGLLTILNAQQFTEEDSLKQLVYAQRMDYFANSEEARNLDSAGIYAEKITILSAQSGMWETYVEYGRWYLYLLIQQGKLAEAKQYGKDLINQAGEHLPKSGKVMRDLYSYYGVRLLRMGEFQASISWQKQALFKLNPDSIPTPEQPNLITNWIYLGFTHSRMRNYEQAILYLQQARSQALKFLNQSPSAFADVAYWANQHLGTTYSRKGEIEEARKYLKKAFELAETYFENESNRKINGYHELGWLAFEDGLYSQALNYGKQALREQETFKARSGGTHQIDNSYVLIGESYTKLGKPEEAIPWLSKGVDASIQAYGGIYNRHFRIAASTLKLADAYANRGSIDTSLIFYQKALVQFCGSFSNTDPSSNPPAAQVTATKLSLFCIKNKALAWEEKYRLNHKLASLQHAYEAYMLCLNVMDLMRRQYRGDASQLFIASEAKNLYEHAIISALKLADETGKYEFQEEAFYLAEQSKAYLLFLQQNEQKAKINLGVSDTFLTREQILKENLAAIQSSLLSEEQKGDQAQQDTIVALKARLFSLNQQYQELIDQLETHYPAYFKLKHDPFQAQITDLVAYLQKSQETLVEYFVGDSSFVCFVIDENGLQAHNLTASTTWKLSLDSLLSNLQAPRYDQQSLESYARHAYNVYQAVLGSVFNESLPSALRIIPEGALGYIPFSALLTSRPEINTQGDDTRIRRAYRNLPFVLNKATIRYAYSARLLLSQPESHKPTKKLLAMAPSYTGSLQLKSNQEQAQSVGNLMNGEVLIGNSAKKDYFLQQASGFDILHLAMHGQSNQQIPMASRLLFYQDADSDSAQAQNLYAYEIYGLMLNASLAVLSACETGAGALARGEGILSLARSFRFAGCKSILYSLWRADGTAANSIIIDFYTALNDGSQKASALQQVKQSYLREASPERIHPYYWATFVFLGDDNIQANQNHILLYISILLVTTFVLGSFFYLKKKRSNS